MLTLLLLESHRRAVGRPLLDTGADGLDIAAAPKLLYDAPCPVLAHDAFQRDDPVFTYANAAAQTVFESDWKGLVGTPSRASAEDDAAIQADRAALLSRAAEAGGDDVVGAVSGYKGWRVSAKGTRFEIQDGTLFNIVAPSGARVGQAVVFSHWIYEDGTHGGPGAPQGAPAPASPTADADAVADAESAVAAAAAAVRELKEGQGKPNADPEVEAAVGVLLAAKARLKEVGGG